MFINDPCRGLFVDMNNTLYCSMMSLDQVVAVSLRDPMHRLSIVAGTGCSGSLPDRLSHPYGIFVDLNISLYVADSDNHRIQRFDFGQSNATTVAGNGASGTITLLHPTDIVLDGDGYVFIVDNGYHRIIGSGPHGFRCVAACSGVAGSAPNQLNSPPSMSFDSYGNIWVTEYSNTRIQKFILNNDSCGEHPDS